MQTRSRVDAFPSPRLGVALLLLAAAALGCSFAYSSKSVSDSSNNSSESSVNSSESSSGSSSPDKKDESARFERDVEQYTLAFVRANGRDGESFFSGLSDLARLHAVSDWESEPATWEAIGRGIARGAASTTARAEYQTAWTGGDPAKQSAVAKGISTVQ